MNTVDCFDSQLLKIFNEIDGNLQNVRKRIERATQRSRRSVEDVLLVGVTKYAKPDDGVVEGFIRAGLHHLAENRPQLLLDKVNYWHSKTLFFADDYCKSQTKQSFDCNSLKWHFIGTLQRNKVRRILPVVSLIHSVDSWKLLETIERIIGEEIDSSSLCSDIIIQATDKPTVPQNVCVLLEVHISNDITKQGFTVNELRQIFPKLATLQHIKVCGLMGMAGLNNSPEEVRRQFNSLHSVFEELRPLAPDPNIFCELSMGMSGDFEIAIEEGATIIRLGSILYPHNS